MANSVGSKPGPRPHTWKTGPDPVVHAQYNAFIQQRNQARFRKETWTDEFDFEQWRALWAPHWHLRGRQPNQMCMTRCDKTKPWTQDNAEIITREEHALRSGALGGKRRKEEWDKKHAEV
jgi:hypothetical protein